MDEMSVGALLSLEHTIANSLFQRITYPFEVLPFIGDYIKELTKTLDPEIFEKKGDFVYIARSAKIAPTASITGPCIICEETEVRHCAFIRGNAIIGKNCVVGNSTEVKNSILFDNVQVPHYNYVGDSVLGYYAHLGAGVITSNVKSDKTLVTVKTEESRIETGLKKFGAVIGDFVEVGCSSVLNPGTVVGKNTNIYPLSSVRGFIPADSIFKTGGEIVEKL